MGTSSETPEKNAIRKQDGGPAFPRSPFWAEDGPSQYDDMGQVGMTLRDYFAAAAITGITANTINSQARLSHAEMAQAAYTVADSMLAARER